MKKPTRAWARRMRTVQRMRKHIAASTSILECVGAHALQIGDEESNTCIREQLIAMAWGLA